MYRSFPEEHQARSPLIYRYFAELEWEQGRPGVALAILLSFAEGSEGSPHKSLYYPLCQLINAEFRSNEFCMLTISTS